MAWNVVIAGGGFGGSSAARELERLLPKQSARLILVNDVNFLLYTPFLPEAAAGTLEPRHVVTPLRDILRRTDLRLGAVTGARPGGAHGRAAGVTTARSTTLRYDQLLVALGSVSRSLPIPGLDRHAIGFKSLADAIWLRNHVVETLEEANATEDPARREELLTYVFVGGGYSGLEALAELQDFAADAIDRYPRARLHGMRWILVEAADRVLPEVPPDLADYAVRELRGRGIDIRLGTRLEEAAEDSTSALDRRAGSHPDAGLDRRGHAAPAPRLARAAARRRGPGARRRAHAGRGHERRLGDRRLRRGPAPGRRRAAVPADRARWRSARARPSPTTSPPSSASTSGLRRFDYLGREAFVNLGRYKAVGKIGRLKFRGFVAWWMARTYHMSQIPGLARKIRAVVDWTVGLPFRARHRRGRLDRPSAPAQRPRSTRAAAPTGPLD